MFTFVIIYPNVDEKKRLERIILWNGGSTTFVDFFFQFCEIIGSLLSTNTTLFGGMVWYLHFFRAPLRRIPRWRMGSSRSRWPNAFRAAHTFTSLRRTHLAFYSEQEGGTQVCCPKLKLCSKHRCVRVFTDGSSLCTREIFCGFNLVLVSEFSENKINLLRSNGIVPLSEQKIRAVVTNAKQIQKVQESVLLQLFASASNFFLSLFISDGRGYNVHAILLSALVIRLNANILMFSPIWHLTTKGKPVSEIW